MARKDFDALRGMVGNDLFADEIFGFHAQQAIEKSLKAWLSLLDIEFPFTHDISRLLALLEDVGADGVTAYLHLVEFTMFAVQARYEAGLMDDEQVLDRPTVITQVQALLSAVESLETKG
ncbi:MAG TPA: HEPN domain-containing protein [Orrella sp.]